MKMHFALIAFSLFAEMYENEAKIASMYVINGSLKYDSTNVNYILPPTYQITSRGLYLENEGIQIIMDQSIANYIIDAYITIIKGSPLLIVYILNQEHWIIANHADQAKGCDIASSTVNLGIPFDSYIRLKIYCGTNTYVVINDTDWINCFNFQEHSNIIHVGGNSSSLYVHSIELYSMSPQHKRVVESDSPCTSIANCTNNIYTHKDCTDCLDCNGNLVCVGCNEGANNIYFNDTYSECVYLSQPFVVEQKDNDERKLYFMFNNDQTRVSELINPDMLSKECYCLDEIQFSYSCSAINSSFTPINSIFEIATISSFYYSFKPSFDILKDCILNISLPPMIFWKGDTSNAIFEMLYDYTGAMPICKCSYNNLGVEDYSDSYVSPKYMLIKSQMLQKLCNIIR